MFSDAFIKRVLAWIYLHCCFIGIFKGKILLDILSVTSPIFMIVFIPLIKHTITINTTKEPKLLDPQLKILALSTFALAFLLGLSYVFNAI